MPTNIFNKKIPQTPPKHFYIGAVLLGFSVFLILAMFQPFGTYSFRHPDKLLLLAGYGIVITFTSITILGILRLLLPRWFEQKRWSLQKELIVLGIILITGITATYFYHFAVIGSRLSIFGYLYFMGIALSTSLFPVVLIVAIRYLKVKNYLEKQALSENLAPKPDVIILTGENKDEKLTIYRSELLFLKAADNYVELFLQKNKQLDRHIIRGTLSGMATQLNDENFIQVHRSYIVNMDKVLEMNGKSPNYVLNFPNSIEPVPVSRNKIQEVRAYLAAKPV
ncbi:MAG: LytTR family transcriptional regulator [Saprospiraceae bacterium]|nr:LytTR family transcriptional regulator [Saprospiraceae bacterium]